MKVSSNIGVSLRAPRRRGMFAVAGSVVALAAAGGAFAWHGSSSASLVSATFYANTVSNSQTQTCTAANNDSIQVSDATFAGTASSTDAQLSGPITIDARSVYDATTNAGSLTGDVQIGSGTSTARFEGRLSAVNVAGHVQGLVFGREGGGGQLLGNLTATFSTSGGFGSPSSLGTIGAGTATDSAILSTSSCASSSEDSDQDDNGSSNQDSNKSHDHHGANDNHGGSNSQD
jgi:hypothetical protein